MNQKPFDDQLKLVNQRLKAANTGVTLIQKGASLYARGIFPAKPGANKTEPHQQEISLKVRATPAGLKVAEAKARQISSEIVLKEFDWTNYTSRPLKTLDNRTIAEWITAFEKDYFERRKRTPKSECTWASAYCQYLRRLPQDKPLTAEILDRTVRQTEPDSCTRAAMCFACKSLGKFAGIDVEFLKSLRGSYSSLRPAPRQLPSDEKIVEAILQIRNPKWRWIAAIIATYGLRPHEAFHLDTQDLETGTSNRIKVLDGKTGSRQAVPLHPEWIEQFNLRCRQVPNVKGRNNRDLGHRVSAYFRKVGIPFKPYDLRHCWAVRALRFGIHVSLSARWMGHSVDIHTKTYQTWLTEEMEQQAYEQSLQNPNRPAAPQLTALSLSTAEQGESSVPVVMEDRLESNVEAATATSTAPVLQEMEQSEPVIELDVCPAAANSQWINLDNSQTAKLQPVAAN